MQQFRIWNTGAMRLMAFTLGLAFGAAIVLTLARVL